VAAWAAPLWLAAALGSRRPPRAARARAPARVVCCAERGRIPSRAAGATLKSRIWDMLGLSPRCGKEEIRQAYKEYVRLNHPDLNGGKAPDDKYAERFTRLTAAYNEVMNMTDDQFWLESFDTGITRMATKRVDGPSLNPWERRFRQWARANDLLDVDQLQDEDVDCRKEATLYIDRCREDPTLEGCEVFREDMEPEEAEAEQAEAVEAPAPASALAEPEPEPARPSAGASEAAAWIGQVLLAVALAVGGGIVFAFLAIVVHALGA